MTFEETLAQVREVLEREGRVAYRVLLVRHESSGIDIDIAFGALPFEEEGRGADSCQRLNTQHVL